MKLTVVFDVQGIDPSRVDPHDVIEAITGEPVDNEFFESTYDGCIRLGQGTIRVDSAEWA